VITEHFVFRLLGPLGLLSRSATIKPGRLLMANARVTLKTVSKPTCCPSSSLANDLVFSVYLKRTFSPRR